MNYVIAAFAVGLVVFWFIATGKDVR